MERRPACSTAAATARAPACRAVRKQPGAVRISQRLAVMHWRGGCPLVLLRCLAGSWAKQRRTPARGARPAPRGSQSWRMSPALRLCPAMSPGKPAARPFRHPARQCALQSLPACIPRHAWAEGTALHPPDIAVAAAAVPAGRSWSCHRVARQPGAQLRLCAAARWRESRGLLGWARQRASSVRLLQPGAPRPAARCRRRRPATRRCWRRWLHAGARRQLQLHQQQMQPMVAGALQPASPRQRPAGRCAQPPLKARLPAGRAPCYAPQQLPPERRPAQQARRLAQPSGLACRRCWATCTSRLRPATPLHRRPAPVSGTCRQLQMSTSHRLCLCLRQPLCSLRPGVEPTQRCQLMSRCHLSGCLLRVPPCLTTGLLTSVPPRPSQRCRVRPHPSCASARHHGACSRAVHRCVS